MKRTRVQRFIGIDARDAAELAERLTDTCEELRRFDPEIKWIDGRYSAVLLYTEHTEEPENLAEEYELRGEGYTCESCPHKVPITDGRARNHWRCEERKRGTDIDCPACVRFYEELERGEIFS